MEGRRQTKLYPESSINGKCESSIKKKGGSIKKGWCRDNFNINCTEIQLTLLFKCKSSTPIFVPVSTCIAKMVVKSVRISLIKCIKLLLRLIFLGVVFYWGGHATIKLNSQPIGTKLVHRVGDDDKGNFKIFALTICPDFFNSYLVLKEENLTASIDFYNIDFLIHQIKSGQSFADNEARLKWSIVDTLDSFEINGQNLNISESQWKPIMDSKFGMCHTFDPFSYKKGIVPSNFLDHHGAYQSAKIKFKFNVKKNYIEVILQPLIPFSF